MSDKTTTTKSAPLVTAHARSLRIAPRKMRLVTNSVKNMYVGDALVQLAHTNKKGAPMLVKLLNSAVANAQHNFSLAPEFLYIKSITTDMGRAMKRYFPRARGSAFIIRKKMCHVNVILEERKKGKVSNARKSFFQRVVKPSKETTESIDQDIATNTKPVSSDVKKSQTPKTSEQKKMNTVQQKRRLFNRKAGE